MNAVGIPNEVWRVVCHPRKPRIAAGGRGGWLWVFDITGDGVQRVVDVKFPQRKSQTNITGLVFSPDGSQIITSGSDKVVQVIDARSGKLMREWQPARSVPHWIAQHPTKPWILVAYQDRRARIIDYESKEIVAVLEGHTQPLRAAAFDPSGHWAATGGLDHAVHVWDLGLPRRGKRRPRR